MPVHDWTRADAGLFHEFHQSWSIRIKDALNSNRMPSGYFAFAEQRTGRPEPDVIAISTDAGAETDADDGTLGVAVRPQTRLVQRFETDDVNYARRANRITIRHRLGEVVAVIEIVSRGNKSSRRGVRQFVGKAAAFLQAGVHMLVIDLFPPTALAPDGLHAALLDEMGVEENAVLMPEDKPLMLVGYDASEPITAFIEPLAVGDCLPDMPLFLMPERHVLVPLEATYQATWEMTPKPLRDLVAPPAS